MVTGSVEQKFMAHNYYKSDYISMGGALDVRVDMGPFLSGAATNALLGAATFTTGTVSEGSFTISINEPWLHRYYREMNDRVRR